MSHNALQLPLYDVKHCFRCSLHGGHVLQRDDLVKRREGPPRASKDRALSSDEASTDAHSISCEVSRYLRFEFEAKRELKP